MMRLALALCLTAACGISPRPDAGGLEVELELGSAAPAGTGFTPMPAEATLVPGAQGGFHVWLSYKVKGTEGAVKAAHTVRREGDGKLLSRGERRLEVAAVEEGGWWQSDGATPAFLCPTPLGVSVIDVSAIFEVTLFSEDARELVKQQVKTQLKCPTDGQADFCQRICKG